MVRHFSGAILGKEELSARIKNSPSLVEGMIDPRIQIGSNGVDLTLNHVEVFQSEGSIDFSNVNRILSDTKPLSFGEDDWLFLKPGIYKVVYNEVVNISRDLIAIAKPRSSLLRCGATVETAVWDAGYRGRSESLLVVLNPNGLKLKRNARIVQLIFIKLTKPSKESYEGIYQGENIP